MTDSAGQPGRRVWQYRMKTAVALSIFLSLGLSTLITMHYWRNPANPINTFITGDHSIQISPTTSTGRTTNAIAFSPCGTMLADASNDKSVSLWDVGTGTCLSSMKGHTASVNSVAFSPNGKTLASGSDDGTVRLWKLPGKRETHLFKIPGSKIMCVAFSPKKGLLAAGGYKYVSAENRSNILRVWEIETLKEVLALDEHKGNHITSISFSPEGDMLATGHEEFWDGQEPKGGEINFLKMPKGTPLQSVSQGDPAQCLSFHPSGTLIASGGFGTGSVYVWSVKSGMLKCKMDNILGNNVRSLCFSPNGEYLAASITHDYIMDHMGHHSGYDIIWKYPSREMIYKSDGYSYASAFSSKRNILAFAGSNWVSIIKIKDYARRFYLSLCTFLMYSFILFALYLHGRRRQTVAAVIPGKQRRVATPEVRHD